MVLAVTDDQPSAYNYDLPTRNARTIATCGRTSMLKNNGVQLASWARSGQMDERQKIDWAQQGKKLLLLLEKQQALPTNHPFSMAKLDEEILAIEELVRSYQVLRANERL
jgi:hypothetical protein